MVTNLYYYFIDYFDILKYILQKNAKETNYMSTNIKAFLEKVSKKRDIQKIPKHLQCILSNRFEKPCTAYREKNSNCCHAHKRYSSLGENHIFSKSIPNQSTQTASQSEQQIFQDFIDDITTFI